MTCLVYYIRCKPNGRLYVGSTTRGNKQRFSEHRHYLRRGSHCAKQLQRCWNKYGEPAFDFEVVETVDDAAFLLAREQFHIWRVRPDLLLNTAPVSDSVYAAQAACRGRVMGAEERAMRSRAQTGVTRGSWTAEQRAAHSIALRGRKMPPVSDSTRKNISASKRGKAPTVAIQASVQARSARVASLVHAWVALREQGHSFRAIESMTGNCRKVIAREIGRLRDDGR